MPSIRRQRAETADANEEDELPPRRRVRLSDERPASAEATETDNGDDSSPGRNLAHRQQQQESRSFLGTQAEFEALIEEESDDESDKRKEARARENLEREIQELERHSGNQERPIGIIETVECINFMCHEHLTITLGPLINFIVGHNGSGKSAVLTALTLCLGGKATSTNRGQSLKGFVKEGKENSTLIVKIKNQGETGYRTDVYGDSIIVERHFSISGSSSFKIKGASGRVISTKRAELDEITDFYALQLDNPVNVLTQDMARQFLNNSSPSEKYKFFIRGVQLEQLHNDYTLVFEAINNTKAQLVNVQETCKILQKKSQDARERFERLTKQDGLRDRVKVIERQHAWAQVEELEKQLEDLEAQVDTAQMKIEKRCEAVDVRSAAYDEENQSHEDAKSACEQTRVELPALEEAHVTAKTAFDTVAVELQEYHQQQKSLYGLLTNCNKTIEKITADITTERNRLAALDDGSNATMVQRVEETERELQEATEAFERHPSEKPRLDQDLKTAELKADDIKSAVDRKKDEWERARARLTTLEREKPDPMGGYHRSLASLQNLIRQNRGNFNHQPVGPVGAHVKLNLPHWSPILEKFIGGTLNNFVVQTKHDEQLLTNLTKRAGYQCSVYIIKPGHIDTRAHEPDSELDTIMRVTTIDDELVRNALIINQQIERVVLTQKRKDALDLMVVGKNIYMCLCFQDGSRYNGHLIAKSSGGNTKMDPIISDQRAPRMMTDNQAQMDLQKDLVSSISQQLKDVQDQHTQAKNALIKCNQALRRHANQHRDLRAAADRASEAHEDAKTLLDEATNTESPLDALKEQLDEQEIEREQHQGQLDASKQGMEQLGLKNKENKRQMDGHAHSLASLQNRIESREKAVRDALQRRERALRRKNEACEAVKDAESEKVQAESNVTQMGQHVADFASEASKICERVPVDRGMTPRLLDEKLGKLREQLARADREAGGTRDQLSKAAVEARRTYDSAEADYQALGAIKTRLQESMNERGYRWKRFRAEIVARARIQFQYLLSERDFNGKLEFDHSKRELDLKVQPEARGAAREGRQTKTLSGGEKSFSTICLLLALWDAMGSPIRCLDEFDVFMDSVNRDISMKMMITAARRSVGRQFVLITPQSMGSLDQGRDIRITLMREPERGQTALVVGGR